jgi:metal-sulfur cluster biosynthetic enzyme
METNNQQETPSPAAPSSDVPAPSAPVPPGANATGLEAQIWSELRQCYDPEIPLNIVDLGLVYAAEFKDGAVTVKMTLTSPGCHLGGQIASSVQERILSLEEVEEANVELVWDPPWHPGLISPDGRRRLGLDQT